MSPSNFSVLPVSASQDGAAPSPRVVCRLSNPLFAAVIKSAFFPAYILSRPLPQLVRIFMSSYLYHVCFATVLVRIAHFLAVRAALRICPPWSSVP